jgi:hypothetical protein
MGERNMSNDKTVILKWRYTTPCGMCGTRISIADDPSGGEKKYSEGATVRASCPSCGHQQDYPASAVDNKLM